MQIPDNRAVTPVIGTILILAITVVGMAAIMLYGAPTIDRIQGQNAQTGVVGEFENVQAQTMELSVPDAARLPTLNIPSGTLSLQAGTRMMVSVIHEDDILTYPCDLHVTGFANANTDELTLDAAGCRAPQLGCGSLLPSESCLEVYQVLGANLVAKPFTLAGQTVTITGEDVSTGNWMVRLTDGNSPPNVYAEAWLFDNDQLHWQLSSSSGQRDVYLDGGAVFSAAGNAVFLDANPPLQEDDFGTGIYVFWLRTLDATTYNSFTGSGTHQVFLGLTGNHGRIAVTDATQVRYDMHGDLAQAWCNSLILRNQHLVGSSYQAAAGFACGSGDADGVRSVTYERTGGAPFEMEFLHAALRANLVL